MLQGKLVLHDIKDVEAFCNAFLKRDGLAYHDREDLLAYLVESTWELSLEFRPGNGRFSVYARSILSRRVYDLERQRFRTRWVFSDRTYERERPVFASLDDRPEQPDDVQSVDVGAYSDSFARWLLRERSGEHGGHDEAVGAEADGAAA